MLLGILKALLTLASSLAGYLHDRQLLKAGEYKAIARSNEEAINAIKAAMEARSGVSDDPSPDELLNDRGNRDPR